jgi:hypothetical protein
VWVEGALCKPGKNRTVDNIMLQFGFRSWPQRYRVPLPRNISERYVSAWLIKSPWRAKHSKRLFTSGSSQGCACSWTTAPSSDNCAPRPDHRAHLVPAIARCAYQRISCPCTANQRLAGPGPPQRR